MTDDPIVRELVTGQKTAAAESGDLDLFRELRRTKNSSLRDGMVLKYQALAEKIARRYASSGEPIEDIIQEGYLGLIKAVDRFDPDQGVQFTTYATHTISGEIRHYLRDLSKLIQEPGWHQQLRYRVLKCSDELLQKLGRQPGAEEIASALDMKEETVRAVLQSGQVFQLDSLDAPEADSAEDSPLKVERLEAPGGLHEGAVEERLVLQEAIGKLKKLERLVIYNFFYQEHTKTEIARKLGISVNYASYLIKRAVRNLKAILTQDEEKEARLQLELMERRLGTIEQRIQQIETADYDTGLASKPQFTKRLREETARARRYHLEFSVMVFQVLWPRKLAAAEERKQSLQWMTTILIRCCREVDLLARFDDSTFVALLPHTGPPGQVVGERVVKAVSADPNSPGVTVECRITTFPNTSTADAILKWIDGQ